MWYAVRMNRFACDTASEVSFEVMALTMIATETSTISAASLALNQEGVCAGAIQVCNGASKCVELDYALIANYEAVG